MTVVDAQIDPARESEFLDGYQALIAGDQPNGLIRSELLRGQDGAWRIHTTWQDLESLKALRKEGKPHAALALLDSVGAEHTHGWFVIETSLAAQ